MTSYYTRAKARGGMEQEDVEQGDSALETTTTTVVPEGRNRNTDE